MISRITPIVGFTAQLVHKFVSLHYRVTARPLVWALVSETGSSDFQVFKFRDCRFLENILFGTKLGLKYLRKLIKVFWGDPGQDGGFKGISNT